jgi:protein-disulfide isomerase
MRQKRAAVGLVALGVVGWAASLYLLVEHIRARITLTQGGACDINAVFNCTVAALSPYSQIAGAYPTAALGAAYYVAFTGLAILLLRGRTGFAPILTGMAALASLYSVALFLISVTQLHALCPGCAVTYLVNFASLVLCAVTFRPMPKLPSAIATLGTLAVCAVALFGITFALGEWSQKKIAAGERIAESERASLAMAAAEKTGLSKKDVEQLGHSASAPAVGPQEAPVNIAVFSDFQCPHCAMFAATLRRIHQHFGNAVRVEYRFYPLPGHQWADLAARLGVCMNDAGKFWEFHDRVFEKQDELSEQVLTEIVDDLGVRTADIVTCAGSPYAKN